MHKCGLSKGQVAHVPGLQIIKGPDNPLFHRALSHTETHSHWTILQTKVENQDRSKKECRG